MNFNDKDKIDLSGSLKKIKSGFSVGSDASGPYISSSAPTLFRWLIKYSNGFIKTEKQAAYVAFAFVLLVFFLSLYSLFDTIRGEDQSIYTPPAATQDP